MTEEERKKRAPSQFTLMKVHDDGTALEPLGTGATDKALMEEAVKCGEGEYAVVNIRRKFSVATKTETVIV